MNEGGSFVCLQFSTSKSCCTRSTLPSQARPPGRHTGRKDRRGRWRAHDHDGGNNDDDEDDGGGDDDHTSGDRDRDDGGADEDSVVRLKRDSRLVAHHLLVLSI